ncbi:MAG: DUF3644 domain-containing protein [Enterocloster asparagiformis]|jgi:hypothetical protein|nr:DUF3644 domain-containing protein [Enterocloster asparagiformis]DAN57320.1 MAG TPA: Protein of unknown function (DUF3644) [Caudoviricetes sp.]
MEEGNILEKLEDRLLEKSKEAFAMAIELYNKPTIKYRVEGFSLFICNAWELMLKAHLIKTKGPDSIYYTDNKNRTITLENAIKNIFTNNKDPLRLNLEKIIELRNTSTHFITEEYEMVYVPLFQSCVLNFNEKMMAFHNVDMTTIIPQNFLTLSVSMKALDASEIIVKYPEEIASRLLTANDNIAETINMNNDKFAIRIEHYHYITKNKDKATSFVGIDNSAEAKVKIIKELKDPNTTHKYSTTSCVNEICAHLKRSDIALKYNGEIKKFNSYHFNLFCKYYDIKSNPKLCYKHELTHTYGYSIQTIDFIVEEIKKDPDNIIQNLKNSLSKK